MKIVFSFFLFIFLGLSQVVASERLYDYVIHNALIFDGVGLEGERKDLGIINERIAAIGDLEEAKAKEIIDGGGLILAPGFMDAHTHSDFNSLIYPSLANKLMQGVTTEIVGNCGMSAAPIKSFHRDQIAGVWAREGVVLPESLPWSDYKEYRQHLEREGMLTNYLGLVGHGNIRSAVMGFSPRESNDADIEAMKVLVAEAMEQGAAGISFGLVYLPGSYAKQKEILEICRQAARFRGVCSFHMRSEGARLLEAIEEVIEIGKKTDARIQISHLKAGGKRNWDKIESAFELIEQARIDGVKVLADAYPYRAGFAELGVILPDELYERPDRLEYFKKRKNHKEILSVMRPYYEGINVNWENTVLASAQHKKYQDYEGKSLKVIARRTDLEPEKLLIALLSDTKFEASAFYFSQSNVVVDKVLSRPYVVVGSDSIADGSRRPHPRCYGTFPKILREQVRKKKLFSMGEAIHKMTAQVAEHFGVPERGQIREGYIADLVLFDATEYEEKATYEDPSKMASGMEWVFVAGKPVISKGQPTGEKAGTFLTRA